jgi:hypothetical protein
MDATLTRDDATHTYLADGVPVPWSVTQILRAAGYIDFSQVPRAVLDEAQARGRRVHRAAALLADDDLDWDSVDPADHGYVTAAADCLRSLGLTVTAVEPFISHPSLGYAGQPDLLGVDRDQLVVVDYKTGDPADVAADLQTAAYVLALNATIPPDQVRPWRRLGIALGADGRFAVQAYTDPRDFTDFLAALAHVNALRRRKG